MDRRERVLVLPEEDWLVTPKELSDECIVVGHDTHYCMMYIITTTNELEFIMRMRGARSRTNSDMLI